MNRFCQRNDSMNVYNDRVDLGDDRSALNQVRRQRSPRGGRQAEMGMKGDVKFKLQRIRWYEQCVSVTISVSIVIKDRSNIL
ncbi:hypothetical protein RRG08_019445 [Elysia crispata]|uniref:Uncharacterized protein n=1 Tax=Elysia crispata TaxID=231223 RepID=A0AAE0YAN7_9GAST|nr:hypothetical protein RRG08_019445 [Elysia crispata]